MRLASVVESETDGGGVREGRVEVCVNGAWGTVCRRAFTQHDADVVCEQLPGFKKEGLLYLIPHSYTVFPSEYVLVIK